MDMNLRVKDLEFAVKRQKELNNQILQILKDQANLNHTVNERIDELANANAKTRPAR